DVAGAGVGVTWAAEAGEALAIDMQQISWARPLPPPWPLTRLSRSSRAARPTQRPPHRRVRVSDLAGDQPRTPAPAPASDTDPLLPGRRQQSRRPIRP